MDRETHGAVAYVCPHYPCRPCPGLARMGGPRLSRRSFRTFAAQRHASSRFAAGAYSPDNRKTRPESEPVAAATTIASGVIHGRNHAERIVHPQTLGEPADCPIAKCRGHLLVQSPLLSRRTMHAWSSDMKDRTADVCLCKALCVEVCSIFVLSEPGEASDQSWSQHQEKGAGPAPGG